MAEKVTIGNAELIHGDCLEVMKSIPDGSVDSIVTDPPYGLGKEPDALAMLTDWLATGHHDVKGSGFMGKAWDAFVPQPALWRECLRVLKPGGHLLTFAGTRTHDLMTLGLRIAGFEIRDTIMWVYGSGFPKSLDVSKAIDKAAGAERKVVGRKVTGMMAGQSGSLNAANGWAGGQMEVDVTAPATPDAERWQGWGTALKPALEPITVARKPLAGTVASNVLAHGTGALNIDGCRVATDDALGGGAQKTVAVDGKGEGWQRPWMHDAEAVAAHASRVNENVAKAEALGRWPANLIHDGSDEVLAGFPESKDGVAVRHVSGGKNCHSDAIKPAMPDMGYGGSGSAARFFYCAKASKRDRDEGLEGFDERNPWDRGCATRAMEGMGSKSGPRRNNHPTVKPTDLMRYLCRLVTPPGGVVLDPFMGSGSTGKAASLEGFAFIGIERESQYFDIACRRIEDAQRQGGLAV